MKEEISTPTQAEESPTPIPQKPTNSQNPTPIIEKPKEPPKPENITVEDKNLIASLLYMKENKLMQESKSTIKLTTVKEAEDSAKEEITTTIKEKLNAIKQEISELQKAGYELKLYGIKLLRVPLKIKVWLSTTERKELEKMFQTLNEVGAVTSNLLKEKEQKDLEKEQKEKEKEQKEKLEKEKSKTPQPTQEKKSPAEPTNPIPPKPNTSTQSQ